MISLAERRPRSPVATAETVLDERIARLVDQAPPLTAEQRTGLARLLLPTATAVEAGEAA